MCPSILALKNGTICPSSVCRGLRSALKTLVFAAPAAAGYTVLLPLLARHLDHRLSLEWPLPGLVSTVAFVLIPAGLTVALGSVWLLTVEGRGTPNPMAPPLELVTRGPYRWSRNPMMVGAWLFGFGLAFALRSPALAVLYLLIVIAGMLYVRHIEEPRLLKVFGSRYRSYMARSRRWL